MSKYWHAFQLSFNREIAYRLNFVLGRLQRIAILITFYFLFSKLAEGGSFIGYTTVEILNYLLIAHVLTSFIFGGNASYLMAKEINDGTFSAYLTRPINYLAFAYFREWGARLVTTVAGFFEVLVIMLLAKIPLILPNLKTLLVFLVLVFFAHITFFLISYSVSSLAFWSREVAGPRFIFDWIAQYASGGLFPLTLLSKKIYSVLFFLPFTHMLYTF